MKQLQEQIKENGKHWFTLTGHFQHTRCILYSSNLPMLPLKIEESS